GLLGEESLRFRPTTRVENACASGSAAVFSAIDALESGRISTALVIGAETMTSLSTEQVTDVLARAGDISEEYDSGLTFPGIFAQFASDYFEKFGDKSEILALIAEKNHSNGCMNPWAQMQKPLDFEFCNSVSEKNPIVAPPLRRTDCSPISDGAAALVITNKHLGRVREVEITGRSQVNDFLPMSRRNFIKFEGPALAWKRALQASGLKVWDLDLAEIHDCFTIAELLTYEAMGLEEFGQGERIILDGIAMRDGKLPINASGGLKAKGHPIGATGVSMFVLTAMQLAGEAESLQLPQADKAGIFNMGGSAVANYVAILERN
ncbi:MAG: thiolase domain-containing protein, partial [Actinomycetota bacterium]